MWSEVRIVRQRHAIRRKQAAADMQMVIGSVFSKEAGEHLITNMKRLDESD